MVFEPRGTVFVILSFEGPDVYSQAGGLGVRVKGLARTLAQVGYQTYLYFCGDPDLPGEESHDSGRLVYRRWCQWISARHRGGVYDGEEEKIRDWNSSLPPSLIDNFIAPAVASGRNVVVMGEEWHTSWSMNLLSESLYYRGLRDRVVILWNANNTFGFHRITWPALALAATITTVSRYMKFKVWERGINPIVIPNGIPRASIQDADPESVADLKAAASAAGYIKRHGKRVRLLMRGGREPHGGEVISHAQHQGLNVVNVNAPGEAAGLSAIFRQYPQADVVNLTTFVSDPLLGVIYPACDAVLANSGHEPFGLVGLEVMAAGGLAVTGATGEDYADAYRNALVVETDETFELVTELNMIQQRPRLAAAIRRRGRVTARAYTWEKVIEQLLLRIEFAAAQQAVTVPNGAIEESKPLPRRATRRGRAPLG